MSKRKSKVPWRWIIVVFILSILTIGGTVGYKFYNMAYEPNVSLGNRQSVYIYIPTGTGYSAAKDILFNEAGIIDQEAFNWVAEQKKYPELLKPGRYRIVNGMSNNALINMLRLGKQEALRFTLNSLRTKQQLAGKVGQVFETDSVAIVSLLNDEEYLKKNFHLESENIMTMFIPNTYELYWNTSADEFMKRMAKEYKSFWNDERKAKAKEIGLSQSEVSIMASIVQNETYMKEDKPVIAGVYMNRIKKRMTLDADPTLIWALGDFSIRRVLDRDKELDSPYNTYKRLGLPPGPICVPSISTIDAVLNHTQHDYLFFCAREDFSGYSNFAKTYSQHLVNARKWQQALNRRRIMR